MSIKFGHVNNTLCRMVEPTPLTLDATFPCVGQFNISDHRTINLRNRKPFILRDINNEGYVHYELAYAAHYSLFEVIGYPVVEGSKYWALYQIRSGKKVVKEGDGELYKGSLYKNSLFYLNGSGYLVTKNAIGLIDPCSEEEFLGLDETGWQIYKEPQPIDSGRWTCFECGVKDSRKGHFPGCSRDGKPESTYKVDPSEVVIHIGCLSGTVRRASSSHFCITCGDHWSMIAFAMLDTPTRELVENLLKAQEEK